MVAADVDQKAMMLFEKYGDNESVACAVRDMEVLRN